MLKPLKRVGEAWPLWHSHHYVKWIKLRSCWVFFVFFPLRVVSEIAARDVHVHPPWECCALDEDIGINPLYQNNDPHDPLLYILPHSFRIQQTVLGFADFAVKEIYVYPSILWFKKVSFLGDTWSKHNWRLWLSSPFHLLFLFVFSAWSPSNPLSLGLVSMYSVTGWSKCPVCFRARKQKQIGPFQNRGTYWGTARGEGGGKD